MASLNMQPYKGTRDFYPEDKLLQNYIFDTWRQVAESYGYEEYDGPMLELTEIYEAKSGEEIVNEQTYRFEDRGGRDVTIRPEMTPTLARMVAARKQELAFPLRVYSIPNLWRYERPQRGRLREHWQLNVDLFGVESTAAEAEMITMAVDIMQAFGASEDLYTIKLNSRQLMNHVLGEYLQLDIEESHRLTKLLDRRSKIENKAFVNQAAAILGDKLDDLLELIEVEKIANLPQELLETDAAEELVSLGKRLVNSEISNAEFDISIVRGFDYYTGIVFEVFDNNPENNRSMFGGGRYDDLLGVFGVKPTPTVGFGMGDVVLAEFLEVHDLIPDLKPATSVYIATVEDKYQTQAQKLARFLRQEGVNVAVDFTSDKVGKQFKVADKHNIPWVIVIGEDEVKQGQYTLRNMKSGKEEMLENDALAEKLKQ